MNLVRANAFERTYEIETPLGAGTAFTIDHEGRQYLVTAKHLLPEDATQPEVCVENRLASATVRFHPLAVEPPVADVAVTPLSEPLTEGGLPLPASVDGLAWSQQLYFLGYPYGLATNINTADPGDRIPFVKSGIWSAAGKVDGVYLIYVDGHNNPGFSGGPVVGFPAQGDALQVCGVVSGYRTERQPVYVGTEKLEEFSATANTGIVIATGIQHVVEAIERDSE
jgi:S1-C subfamily serine protease